MPREKICVDCGRKFTLKDDAPKDFDVCVFCLMKKMLVSFEKEVKNNDKKK